MLVALTLGTRLESNLPVTVTVSALESPRSTLPVAFNSPLKVVVLANAEDPDTFITPNVEMPVTPSVPLAVILVASSAANVLVPVTPSVLDNVVAPDTPRVPVTDVAPTSSIAPVPLGSSVKLPFDISVEIVDPLILILLRLDPPSSVYISVKFEFTFVNAALNRSPVPSS